MIIPEPPEQQKHGSIEVNGRKERFDILKEVRQHHTGHPGKFVCLQLVRFEDGRKEIRACYYIISKDGNWIWANNPPLLPISDFNELVQKAQRAGLFLEAQSR